MDLKETIRQVVREELVVMLDTLPAGQPGERGEKGEPGEAGPPGETPSITHLEARIQNLINETESKVAQQMAAVRVLGGKE